MTRLLDRNVTASLGKPLQRVNGDSSESEGGAASAGGSHSSTSIYPIAPGRDPLEVAHRVGQAIGASPAPGVSVEASETPQPGRVFGRDPITVSTALTPDGAVVDVVAMPGHSFESKDPRVSAGVAYEVTASGTKEQGGTVTVVRNAYGDSKNPSLRWLGGVAVLGPWTWNLVKGVVSSPAPEPRDDPFG